MASIVVSHIARGYYRDSVWLMRLAQVLLKQVGVQNVGIMMATAANKSILRESNLFGEGADAAGANDIIISVRADDGAAAESVMSQAVASLQQPMPTGKAVFRTLGTALTAAPDANLVLISVPGMYAAGEARAALNRGLNVMLFSDNVDVSDEIRLKSEAAASGLLAMGPDCGTAIINGVGVGFANAVRRGTVGIVGASGTGIQEVSCLLDRAGLGISQALGVGSHDVSAEVGGRAMLQCLDMLDADSETEVIVLVSKPPAQSVGKAIRDRASRCQKPVVLCLLGADSELATPAESWVSQCHLLEQVIPTVCRLVGHPWVSPESDFWISELEFRAQLEDQRSRLKRGQNAVFGVYSGGTLRDQAVIVLTPLIGPIATNATLNPTHILNCTIVPATSLAIDVGADELTLGRAHPMIDPTLRSDLIQMGALAPRIGIVLFDVVLGQGAHPDPAGAAADAVINARSTLQTEGRDVAFVASVVGVEADPQGFSRSRDRLIEAGVAVMPTTAQAARFAAALVKGALEPDALQFCEPPSLSPSPDRASVGIWGGRTVVINIGLDHLHQSLESAGVTTLQVEWRPIAGGDPELAARLALIT